MTPTTLVATPISVGAGLTVPYVPGPTAVPRRSTNLSAAVFLIAADYGEGAYSDGDYSVGADLVATPVSPGAGLTVPYVPGPTAVPARSSFLTLRVA